MLRCFPVTLLDNIRNLDYISGHWLGTRAEASGIATPEWLHRQQVILFYWLGTRTGASDSATLA